MDKYSFKGGSGLKRALDGFLEVMGLADAVTRMADAQAAAYAKKIEKVYTQAAKEVKKKMDDFWKAHKGKAERLRKQVQAGTISERDYQAWLRGQVFQGKQWEQKLKDVTEVYVNADAKAREILGGTTKNVFMQAANHTAYDIEKQFSGAVAFNVYDRRTVEQLTKDNPKMLPEWKINEQKDYIWNEERVQNAVTQGIIQGESVRDIGSRLTNELATTNAKKMDMFARTAVNGAQNAGRIERLKETEEMGIKVKKKWLATLDNRTRDAHAELDGQEKDIDEDFVVDGKHIAFPGDPACPWPELVYNCRCTLIYVYPKYQHLNDAKRRDQETGEVISDMTYKEWEAQKQEHKNVAVAKAEEHTIAQGTNIIDTWKRRQDEFAFEIEDVMDTQGFDGKPIVVDADEFDKAVQESGFIAQRTYSAPDQETLDAYRNQLYDGKWYVDCSTGGAQYGQGMYCAADYTGTLTDGIREEMKHYIDLNKTRGNSFAFTETLTLDKSAKIIKYDELEKKFKEYNKLFDYDAMIKNAMNDVFNGMGFNASQAKEYEKMMDGYWTASTKKQIEKYEALKKKLGYSTSDVSALAKDIKKRYNELVANKIGNIGSYAVSLGYDAINASGHGASGSYTVILNRTKVIFRRDK